MDEYEELLQHIEKIKEHKQIIIVEGIKDKRALQIVGISINQIISLKKPLYAVVEEVIKKIEQEKLPKKVVLLTDLDPRGKKLYAALNRDLNRYGIEVNNTFRNFLAKNTKLRQIEGLTSYLNKIHT